jgi:membrane protein implicated in regulation of membrane protease activity
MDGLSTWSAAHWWVLGLALLVLEVFIPGTVLLWFGVAALIVGTLAAVLPMPWQLEVLLFAALGVASLLTFRKWYRRHPEPIPGPPLNQRAQLLLGQVYTLQQGIENGRGKLQIGDAYWSVRGSDLPAGTRVRVVAVDDMVLRVEAER